MFGLLYGIRRWGKIDALPIAPVGKEKTAERFVFRGGGKVSECIWVHCRCSRWNLRSLTVSAVSASFAACQCWCAASFAPRPVLEGSVVVVGWGEGGLGSKALCTKNGPKLLPFGPFQGPSPAPPPTGPGSSVISHLGIRNVRARFEPSDVPLKRGSPVVQSHMELLAACDQSSKVLLGRGFSGAEPCPWQPLPVPCTRPQDHTSHEGKCTTHPCRDPVSRLVNAHEWPIGRSRGAVDMCRSCVCARAMQTRFPEPFSMRPSRYGRCCTFSGTNPKIPTLVETLSKKYGRFIKISRQTVLGGGGGGRGVRRHSTSSRNRPL